MMSEQRAELVRCHADDVEDAPQGSLRHVTARVHWDWNRTSIRVLHHVMATSDPRKTEPGALQRLDDLRSRYRRDGARHKPGSYQKSGDVECHSQLIGWLDYFEQSLKRVAQVGDGLFLRRPFANRADARAKDAGGAPGAVLILLDGIGHVNDTSHGSSMSWVRSGLQRTTADCSGLQRSSADACAVSPKSPSMGRLGTS
jgi:hypothetical protein